MGVYRDQLLPRLTDVVLASDELARIRERVASGLDGEVLEVGFGSGLNVPHYPRTVDRVRAVEPSRVALKLAQKRVATSGIAVEYVGAEGGTLPLADRCVDHVLVTWTLCTIADVSVALAEMRRVLRPGGRLHFVEHGRSPHPRVARWQDVLNPLQRRWAGGCNLNRSIDRLVEAAGFELEKIENYYVRAPRLVGYLYEGVGIKV